MRPVGEVHGVVRALYTAEHCGEKTRQSIYNRAEREDIDRGVYQRVIADNMHGGSHRKRNKCIEHDEQSARKLNTAVILTAETSRARQAKNSKKYTAGINLRSLAGI